MKTRMIIWMMFLVLSSLVFAPAVRADGEDERNDKAAFNRLVRELHEIHKKYTLTFHQAVKEARKNNGKASMETKARILAVRDEIDRKMTRLLLIALRHGWEVPKFGFDQDLSPESKTSAKERVFSPVDDLIRTTLAHEARELAAKVKLPVVSISTPSVKKDK